MMDYNDIEQIKKDGFVGFVPIKNLIEDDFVIPAGKGIYLILNLSSAKPEFLFKGTGGYFKGKEPNVSIAKLNENWLDDTIVIYIGKADIGKKGSRGLKKRLKEYLSFGQGKPIGHSGGKYIWQLKNSADLVVCWKVLQSEDPETV